MERIINNLKLLPQIDVGHLTEIHINAIQKICELTNPSKILEFGFNVGHSAIMWLELSKANLTSYDNSDSKEVLQGAKIVLQLYKGRFDFRHQSSGRAKFNHRVDDFDLLFVDAGHSHQDCLNDLSTGHTLNVPYILVDDYNNFGGVESAVKEFIDNYPYDIHALYNFEVPHNVMVLLKREE